MWVFSQTGFISIVELQPQRKYDNATKTATLVDKYADQLPEDYIPATDETLSSHLMVRARVRADLDALKEYDPDAIESESKTADYQFRLVIRREAVANFLFNQVMTLDYESHVKEELNRRSPQVPGGRMTALYAIWNAMAKLQPNPPYGGYSGFTTTSWKSSSTSTSVLPGKTTLADDGWDAVVPPKDGSVSEADAIAALDEWLDEEAAFPEVEGREWESQIQRGLISRRTMEHQIEDLLLDSNLSNGRDLVDQIVDKLQERFGTIDINEIEFDDLWATVQNTLDGAQGTTEGSK